MSRTIDSVCALTGTLCQMHIVHIANMHVSLYCTGIAPIEMQLSFTSFVGGRFCFHFQLTQIGQMTTDELFARFFNRNLFNFYRRSGQTSLFVSTIIAWALFMSQMQYNVFLIQNTWAITFPKDLNRNFRFSGRQSSARTHWQLRQKKSDAVELFHSYLPLRYLSPLFEVIASRPIFRLLLTLCMMIFAAQLSTPIRILTFSLFLLRSN